MKQFFIILAAILVAAGIIGLVVAISDAKAHHDQFEQSIDDLKKQEGN